MAKKKDRDGDVFSEIDELMRDNPYARKMMLMMGLASMGVTPDEYREFLEPNGALDTVSNPFDAPFGLPMRKHTLGTKQSLKDADKKSLRLKIQLKGIAKPPMWRMVTVPAEYNFSQLHYVIQAVTGLTNSHLWQFQEKAYDNNGYTIGIEMEDNPFGEDDITDNANETPITAILAKKGDKVEYVYDFGDDWIFSIKVEEVMERQGEVPQLLKWKSDLQPIEDTGGPYMYVELRDLAERLPSMKEDQIEEIASQYGYDDPEWLTETIEDARIDPELIAESLSEIPSHSNGPR